MCFDGHVHFSLSIRNGRLPPFFLRFQRRLHRTFAPNRTLLSPSQLRSFRADVFSPSAESPRCATCSARLGCQCEFGSTPQVRPSSFVDATFLRFTALLTLSRRIYQSASFLAPPPLATLPPSQRSKVSRPSSFSGRMNDRLPPHPSFSSLPLSFFTAEESPYVVRILGSEISGRNQGCSAVSSFPYVSRAWL